MAERFETGPADQRVFFRDVKPYEVPDSLDQLHGPAGGVVQLSHSCCGHRVAAASTWTSPAVRRWHNRRCWPRERWPIR